MTSAPCLASCLAQTKPMPPLAPLMMGTASEWFGLRLPVAVGGGICILGYIWALKRRRKIAETLRDGASSAPTN